MKLRTKKLINFKIPRDYREVDYRDTRLSLISRYVVGAGFHDMVVLSKEDKTYMTYCSESPFGIELHKMLKEKRI
jgi:hypothetical protein